MYQRIINLLMQKQKHHGVVVAAPNTVSLLTKSKGRSGAISSLSLSSSYSSASDSDQNNNNESASSTNNNVLLNNNNNNRKSTTHAVSKTCEGQLVARVIPKEYSDYDTTRKSPLAQVDSKGFISSLLSWKQKQKDMQEEEQVVQDTDADEKYPQLQECISLSEDDEEAVVVLDLYLIRSAYIDQQLEKNNEASCQKQEGQSREQRIRALMNSLDVTRHTRIKSRTSEVSKNNTIEPRNLQSTLSTTTSSVSAINDNQHENNDEHELLSNNIYHLLHMNRSSDELASRTLKRLELSTVRKLLSLLNNDEKKKVTYNIRKEENAMIQNSTSSRLVVFAKNEKVDEDANAYGACSEVDLSSNNLSSAEMINMLSSSSGYDTKDGTNWSVALTVPKVILPWGDEDTNVGEEYSLEEDKSTAKSSESSTASHSSTSPFKDATTLDLQIISNPPTILSISTWENFMGDVYSSVPLVIKTTIIHATHAIITWFVNGEVVVYNSNMYTPTANDVGKQISVLVTPIRKGYDGSGCQEAYSFSKAVKALPLMPIIGLREGWCSRELFTGMKVTTQNNLRVVTVRTFVLFVP